MLSQHGVTRVSMACLLVAVLAMRVVAFAAQAPKDSAEAARLLAEARVESAQLARDALAMKSYTTSNISGQSRSHAALIEQINEHVSRAGSLGLKLQDVRATASAQQQEAIDRVDPLLKDLAASVNSTAMRIPHVSEVVKKPPYKDYLEAKARLAADLANLIAAFSDYGEAKTRAQELEHEIELINYD